MAEISIIKKSLPDQFNLAAYLFAVNKNNLSAIAYYTGEKKYSYYEVIKLSHQFASFCKKQHLHWVRNKSYNRRVVFFT